MSNPASTSSSRLGERLLARLPARLRAAELVRFMKFAVVGGSGVVVNQGLFALAMAWLLIAVPYPARLTWAATLGISISILTNFLLNDAWTWGDRHKRGPLHFLWRLSKYSLVASVAAAVQVAVLHGLVHFGLDAYLANFLGIVGGIGINFVANNWWTFRTGADDTPVPTAEPEPEPADTMI